MCENKIQKVLGKNLDLQYFVDVDRLFLKMKTFGNFMHKFHLHSERIGKSWWAFLALLTFKSQIF